jgi:hypothetical protein
MILAMLGVQGKCEISPGFLGAFSTPTFSNSNVALKSLASPLDLDIWPVITFSRIAKIC